MDLVGLLPLSNRYCYLLSCVDHFTSGGRRHRADITTPTIARAFVHTRITGFGVPLTFITDRGSQFELALFRELTLILPLPPIFFYFASIPLKTMTWQDSVAL